ncbi:hypothetical protein JW777_02780, partial [bacterium]|nr:hypothetical protein [bacterium]
MKKKNMPHTAAAGALYLAAFLAPALLNGQAAPAVRDTLPKYSTDQDHRNMMNQLGIVSLRPGPSGDESKPDHANYDTSLANPFPDWPD